VKPVVELQCGAIDQVYQHARLANTVLMLTTYLCCAGHCLLHVSCIWQAAATDVKPAVTAASSDSGNGTGSGRTKQEILKETIDAVDRYGFSPLMCAASLDVDGFGDAPTTLCRYVRVSKCTHTHTMYICIMFTH
jgi:hypothetical protein